MHFQYTTKFLKSYDEVKNILNKYLPEYEKTTDVYENLKAYTTDAIQRAGKLEQYHQQNGEALPLGIAVNPFTEVGKLVEKII